MTRFNPAERRNWGYWDGVNARQRGRLPQWSPRNSGGKHPFDKPYGEGFWRGWYGEDHPNGENAVTRSTRDWLISRNEWPHAA